MNQRITRRPLYREVTISKAYCKLEAIDWIEAPIDHRFIYVIDSARNFTTSSVWKKGEISTNEQFYLQLKLLINTDFDYAVIFEETEITIAPSSLGQKCLFIQPVLKKCLVIFLFLGWSIGCTLHTVAKRLISQ